MTKQRGGKRIGAGRREGSRNARTVTVMEYLDADKNNPVVKLVDIMNKAYRVKDLRLAADCAKALLPYYAPRPKLPDGNAEEVRTPIQVRVNIPIPGSGWRDKYEAKNVIYEHQDDADTEHSVE